MPGILLAMAALQVTQYIADWTSHVEYMAPEEAALEPRLDIGDVDRKGIWMALHAMLPIDLRLSSDGTYMAYFGGDIGSLRGAYTDSDSVLRLQVPQGAKLGRLPRDSDGALLLRRNDDRLLLEAPGMPGGLPVVLSLASTETRPESSGA